MTAFAPANFDLVKKALDRLRRRNAGRKAYTNYFFQDLSQASNFRMLESEENLCFLHDEWDFSRVYFQVFDAVRFEEELRNIAWPPIVVTDWISKTGVPALDSLLKNLGFHSHAIYDRIIYKNPRHERANGDVDFAKPTHRDAIHALLFRTFDKYADHIMSLEELASLIAREEVILSADTQGSIDGLVVLPINGQNCNFNFLYNSGRHSNLSHLLGKFYSVLTDRGVQTGFSWVRRTRTLVLKLHESAGWQRDGCVDHIYLR